MKVYLCYEDYDDGESYYTLSHSYLKKIFDSKEKAEAWIFSQAKAYIEKCIKYCKEHLKGVLLFDEDGPYYDDRGVDEIYQQDITDELIFFEDQLAAYTGIVSGKKAYEVTDLNGYEDWTWRFVEKEVE